jgi:hypothetical protein
MHFVTYMAWMGAAVSLYGTSRYIIGVVKDGTSPRLASWIAWLIANTLMMYMAFQGGATSAGVFDALSALGNAGVLLASVIKRTGQRPSGQTDWVCLGIAGSVSLVNAAFPQLAMVGTVLAMFANLVATWPTMVHAWQEPYAETWQLFAANAGASFLGVIGVSGGASMKITTIAGPLVAMIGNVTLTGIALGRRYKREISSELATIQEEVSLEIAEVETRVAQDVTRVEARTQELIQDVTEVAQAVPGMVQRTARKKAVLLGSEAGF